MISAASEQKAKRERTARLALLASLPNLVAVFAAFLFSNSIALIADFLLSVLDFATVFVVWWVSRLALRGKGVRLEYGFGKVESLTAGFVGIFMLLSLGIIIGLAVARLQSGDTELEGDGVIIGLVANAVSGAINLWLLARYRRQSRADGSPVVRSQVVLFIDKLTSNLVMILALGGSLVFAGTAFGLYLDPLASLLIAASMAFWATQLLRRALAELVDAACGEDVQMPVTRALAQHFDHYDGLGTLRTRRAGSEVFIEIELEFEGRRTVAELHRLEQQLRETILENVPNARVSVLPRLLEPRATSS